MSKVLLKDIAKELGVSSATVSLVLNGKEKEGRVSKIMADKIRQKAIDMNYEPNNLARSLRVGKTYTIGLIVADISNIFFSSLAFHIQEYAEELGYAVIIANTNESDVKMERMIDVLRSRQVDGFIIVPTENGEPIIEDIVKRKIPLVLLDRAFPNVQANHVVIDNYQASRNAVQYLLEKGCKRPALFIYDTCLMHMQERKRGYIDAMKSAGLYNPDLIKEVRFSNLKCDIEKGLDDLVKGKDKEHIDAVYFATNTISMLGVKHLMDLKINIKEDLKIVCFDKSDAFDFIDFPMPYIVQPIPEMGKYAVDLLVQQIDKVKPVISKIELFVKLANT